MVDATRDGLALIQFQYNPHIPYCNIKAKFKSQNYIDQKYGIIKNNIENVISFCRLINAYRLLCGTDIL